MIYARVTYGHDMGITLKARKEAVIPHPDDPKENATKSTKYIWHLEYKNYIVRRDKLTQYLKRTTC